MDLPNNVSTGTVHGRYLAKTGDGTDPNQEPDAVPVSGSIVFTASVPYLPDPTALPDPVTIMTVPIVGVLDREGYLCTPYADTGEPMYRGVKLAATDDPDVSVQDWTWDVTYVFDSVEGHRLAIPPHGFALPSGESVDLTKVSKVPSSPGYSLPQAEAAVLRAEAIAQSIRDDANAGLFNGTAATLEIGDVTSGATANVVNVGDEQHAVLNITLEKGDQGDTGAGVPTGGAPLQLIRKSEDGDTTEWADPSKSLVGLSNVDNTADIDKPVSGPTELALELKQDALIEDPADPGFYLDLLDTMAKRLVSIDENYNFPAPLEGKLGEMFVGRGELTLNVKDAGATGDWTTDDAQALGDVFAAVATLSIRKVVVPAGTYRTSIPLDLAASDTEIVFEAGASIILDSPTFTDRPLTVSGHRNRIVGGLFTSTIRKKFLLTITGTDNMVEGIRASHAAKSTMAVVPGTSIIYNQGGVELRGARNTVSRAGASNTEGAGIYIYGDGNSVSRSHTHDNCTGIIVEPGATNASILDSIIVDNNVNNAEGYDGILATCDGLTVRGNLIAGNGEHGTYLHGKSIIVSGNVVRRNYFNGIKLGNVESATVMGNVFDSNNTSMTAGESQIYVQKSFKRVTIVGNTETGRLAGNFIRAWSDQATDEILTVALNVGLGNIEVHAGRSVVVDSNTTEGDIKLGYVDSTYPRMTGASATGNTAKRIIYGQCTKPRISGNTMVALVGIGLCEAVSRGNIITGQDVMIPLQSVKEFSDNDINFLMTANTDTLFQQDSVKRSGFRFRGNRFTSAGGRFLFFTSETISPDAMMIAENVFEGVLQPLYFWGTGHQIVNNRADQQMGFLGCNNSIITGNIKEPSMRAGLTGNVVANNIP